MARIRTIKPEFWKHESLCEQPEATHMLAAALINYADDFGYFNANPGLIKGEVYPLREPSVSIPESLRRLQTIGYIRLGTADGRRYGQIVHFDEHQRVSHPTASKISILPITWDVSGINPEPFVSPPEVFVPEQGTGNREQGSGKEQGERDTSLRSAPAPQPIVQTVEAEVFDERATPVIETPPRDLLGDIPAHMDRRPKAEIVPLDPIERAKDAYNIAAERVNWPVCQSFTDARRAALRKRLAQCGGFEGWCTALTKAVQSKFLRGENERGWRPGGIDFFLQAKSFTKLMEGAYDDTTGQAAIGRDIAAEGFTRAAAAYPD